MNTELAKLRQQMAELQPGTLTELTERAAPFIAKAVGYAELIRSVMPAARKPREPEPREPERREAGPAPVVLVERRPWWRGLPWKRYALGGGLAVAGGAVAYLGWRNRPRAR